MEYGFHRAVRGWLVLGACALAACQNAPVTSIVANASRVATDVVVSAGDAAQSPARFAAARNCRRVGLLFPELNTMTRWEQRDRPLVEAALTNAIPGVRIDYANAQGDADAQQQQAVAMLDNGACILIVAAQDSVKAATIVQLAAQRSVPVIAYDRLIQSADLAYLVAHDSLKAGELQGQWLVDHAPAGAAIIMINGSPTDENAETLQKGVMNRLRPQIEQGRFKLIFEISVPNWNSQMAAASVAQVLDANQNAIQVIYVANDDMANAVIGVLQSRGLAGKVLVTGQDASADGVRNIVAGWQGMTVFRDPRRQAANVSTLVGALSRGEDPAGLLNGRANTAGVLIGAIYAEPVLVDRDNVNDVVLRSGLVTQADVCGVSAESTACP